ncbi:hypothetical protein L2E82_02330 [Cichorium intybus]|uniref:Uncharacterized protein n=1 Tax=Cichorium intybus TaxID=13427 RepID=A0ACB9H1Z6_CICIN|nr:hypothetical protein L2E82_02330 [Cichorium intybus]
MMRSWVEDNTKKNGFYCLRSDFWENQVSHVIPNVTVNRGVSSNNGVDDGERDDVGISKDDGKNKEPGMAEEEKGNPHLNGNNYVDGNTYENNMYMEESDQNSGKMEKRGEMEFDIRGNEDSQVEESIGIIKEANEINKNEVRIEEEVGGQNTGSEMHPVNPIEQSECWPPMGEMAAPVVPNSNSQPGPFHVGSPQSPRRTVEVDQGCLERNWNEADEAYKSSGGDSTEEIHSNSQDCEVKSLDLNSDPIEIIEEQFLRHKHKDKKGKKLDKQTLGAMSLKLKDVVRAKNVKKQKRPHKSQSANQSPSKSLNSVSMELELTKKVGSAVGFQLEGHEHMLRSEIEGEGVYIVQR